MNDATTDLEDAVIRAIAEDRGMAPHEINLGTRLAEDLGIDGDDADELLSVVANRFNVDFSLLQFDRHFGTEGLGIVLTVRETIKPSRSYPLTVQDLVAAAKTGTFAYDDEHREFTLRRPWHVWIGLMIVPVIGMAALLLFK